MSFNEVRRGALMIHSAADMCCQMLAEKARSVRKPIENMMCVWIRSLAQDLIAIDEQVAHLLRGTGAHELGD